MYYAVIQTNTCTFVSAEGRENTLRELKEHYSDTFSDVEIEQLRTAGQCGGIQAIVKMVEVEKQWSDRFNRDGDIPYEAEL